MRCVVAPVDHSVSSITTDVGVEKLIQVIFEGNNGCHPNFQREFLILASMTSPAITRHHASAPPT